MNINTNCKTRCNVSANPYEMLCVIRYHLYNLKNVRDTHGEVLLLVKASLLHECFSHFLNCANGTKSHNASHIKPIMTGELLLTLQKIRKNDRKMLHANGSNIGCRSLNNLRFS